MTDRVTREWLAGEHRTPADADMRPEVLFVLEHSGAIASLLVHHTEIYRELLRRYKDEGPSDEVEEQALDAAGNIAAILQSTWRRPDLMALAREVGVASTHAWATIEQVLFSLLLLTGPGREDVDSALSEDELDLLLGSPEIKSWQERVARADAAARAAAGADGEAD